MTVFEIHKSVIKSSELFHTDFSLLGSELESSAFASLCNVYAEFAGPTQAQNLISHHMYVLNLIAWLSCLIFLKVNSNHCQDNI
jgi:hypothetical protein